MGGCLPFFFGGGFGEIPGVYNLLFIFRLYYLAIKQSFQSLPFRIECFRKKASIFGKSHIQLMDPHLVKVLDTLSYTLPNNSWISTT